MLSGQERKPFCRGAGQTIPVQPMQYGERKYRQSFPLRPQYARKEGAGKQQLMEKFAEIAGKQVESDRILLS